jgi:hypothetical protein
MALLHFANKRLRYPFRECATPAEYVVSSVCKLWWDWFWLSSDLTVLGITGKLLESAIYRVRRRPYGFRFVVGRTYLSLLPCVPLLCVVRGMYTLVTGRSVIAEF